MKFIEFIEFLELETTEHEAKGFSHARFARGAEKSRYHGVRNHETA
jgi:hypothetical protein